MRDRDATIGLIAHPPVDPAMLRHTQDSGRLIMKSARGILANISFTSHGHSPRHSKATALVDPFLTQSGLRSAI